VRIRTFAAFGASAVLALGVAACGSDDNKSDSTSTDAAAATSTQSAATFSGAINAGGSTFAKPVYDTWGSKRKDQGLTFNFAGTGSGAGVAGVTDGTLDFGGSDSAMDDDEIKAAAKKGEIVHVPTFFGAVTASYNVKGIETGLKLDGETLANIFLGDVKTWNDPQIADQNPDVKLPDEKISVCHRSDESGTTKAFLTYLGAYSKKW
jgi:phosphate transport system substrate-binding protein